jgi:glycosyltransferase involved in cell wall biosynthesis
MSLRLHDIPLVWTAHGFDSAHVDFNPRVRPILNVTKRWLVRQCDAVSAASRNVEQKIVAAGVPPERVRVIYTGVRTERFASVPTAKNNVLTIGSAGRFVPLKGYAHFIDAAAIVVKHSARPLRFVVFGTGPEEGALRERIRERGLTGVFELRSFTDDVPGAFAGMDVFVVPSIVDSFPLVLCEALVAGRPVIATTVGGLPDAFVEGTHGFFVPPGDAPALAAAIGRFVADPSLAVRMGEAARTYASLRYRWSKVADEYDDLYALATR